MRINQRKMMAWAFCFLAASVTTALVGGFAFFVLHLSATASASAGAGAFVVVVGWGAAVIGPFHFGNDDDVSPGAPTTGPQQGAPVR
ncbi:hypothetical protein ACFQ6B_30975 [Streptomyces wedmorensis]|uniref:Secreted protein n=1 Tax=Streptomyces wedmorensis TaxID=43759 RepID=A0ABW6J638_STRWE